MDARRDPSGPCPTLTCALPWNAPSDFPFRFFSFDASAAASRAAPLSDDVHIEPGYHAEAFPLDYALIGTALVVAFAAWKRSRR